MISIVACIGWGENNPAKPADRAKLPGTRGIAALRRRWPRTETMWCFDCDNKSLLIRFLVTFTVRRTSGGFASMMWWSGLKGSMAGKLLTEQSVANLSRSRADHAIVKCEHSSNENLMTPAADDLGGWDCSFMPNG